jgi:hypothetical protein
LKKEDCNLSLSTVSIKRFREAVDSIDEDFDRILVKIAYLTGARASELCNKTSPFDLLMEKFELMAVLSQLPLNSKPHYIDNLDHVF